MSVYPKHAALPSSGRNWAGADRPQPFSTRFASVYRFCVASLWEDPECRPGELENGLDWCQHDTGGQRKTGAVDG